MAEAIRTYRARQHTIPYEARPERRSMSSKETNVGGLGSTIKISIPQSNAPKTQGRFQQGRKEANPSRTKIPKKGCRQNQAAFPKYNRQGSRVGRAYRARIAVKRGRSSTMRTPYELSVPNEHDLGEKLDVSRKARNEGRKSESFNKN